MLKKKWCEYNLSSNYLLESLLSSEFSFDYLLQYISWGILSLTALQALWICVLSCFGRVRLFVTPWTVAHQVPLSLGFSRQEYWSGLPLGKFPKSLVLKLFLPEMATRRQGFFMPKSGSSGNGSLHERSLPGCKWEANVPEKKHPRAGVLLFLPHYPSEEGNDTPLQYSCLENPMDGEAWWAAVHGVAKSRTWLTDFTFTFHFHALEKEMAIHSSVLAWRIPGTGEPGEACHPWGRTESP